jgi:hypothetical protein
VKRQKPKPDRDRSIAELADHPGAAGFRRAAEKLRLEERVRAMREAEARRAEEDDDEPVTET